MNKKTIWISVLALCLIFWATVLSCVAQVTDGTLGTQNTSTIYGQGYSPKRAGDMHQAIIDSKVNKRTPVFLDSADITKQIKFQLNGLTTGTTHTVTWPNKGGTLAFLDDLALDTIAGDARYFTKNGDQNIGSYWSIQSPLFSKSLTFDTNIALSSNTEITLNANNGITIGSAGVVTFTGDTRFFTTRIKIRNPGNTFQYSLVSSSITADRNITLPLLTNNDTFVFENHSQTLTNKTLTSPVINTQISGTVTSGGNITSTNFLVGATATQTLSGKTLTSPVINTQISGGVTSGGNITATNYLVGATATQTLTNKTINGANNTIIIPNNITGTTGTVEGAVVTATTVDGVVIAEELVSITTNGANTTLITQIEPTTDSLALVADFVKVHAGSFSILTGGQTETLAVSSYDGASTLSVNRSTRSTNIAGLLPGIEVAVNTTVNDSYVSNCLHHTGPSAIDVTIPSDLQDKSVVTFIQRSTGAINLVAGANVVINGKTSTTGAWDMIWLYLVYKSGGISYYVGR